jgi:hypothetical protein
VNNTIKEKPALKQSCEVKYHGNRVPLSLGLQIFSLLIFTTKNRVNLYIFSQFMNIIFASTKNQPSSAGRTFPS